MRKSILLALFFLCNAVFAQTPAAKDVIGKMMSAIDGMKTARYVLEKQERIGRKLSRSQVIVKLNVIPLKVYVYSVEPNPGAEVLYIKGENNDNVMVKANKFPYVTLNLGLQNSLLRSNQHHIMSDVGFNYLGRILKNNIEKTPDVFFNSLSTEGLIDYKGKSYYKLVIENKSYAYYNYEVKKGENVSTIAEKLNVSDYMILHLNPGLNDYYDVHVGQRLKVPNSYAKKIILYVDKTTMLPFVQFIYDDKGLYEQYEMSSFVLNPVISPAEFTPKYKDYHF